MRVYVARYSICCCGKAEDVLKMLAPLAGSRTTLKEYIWSLLH